MSKGKKSAKSSDFSNNVWFGFAAGLGINLASLIFIFIGMALFIPGLILLSKEKKKPKEEKNQTNIYIAYGLMAVGCILGLGLGAGFLFTEILNSDF